MRRLALILISAFFIPRATAQQPLYTHFTRFTTDDGLPQSFVSAIVQDADGFLWVGTRDGLARYDGREFRVIRHDKDDSTSLSSNVIYALYRDSRDLLWVFYENQKFDCFDPRSLRVIHKQSFARLQNLFLKNKTTSFLRDRSGRFWLGTDNDGVVCFDPVSEKTVYYNVENKKLVSDSIAGIHENPEGSIYIFTDKGLEITDADDTKTDQFIPFPDSIHFKFNEGHYHQSGCLSNGDCMIANSNQVIVYNASANTFRQIAIPVRAEKDAIRGLVIKDRCVYLTADGGVYSLDRNLGLTYLWQYSGTKESDNSAISFFVDRSNVLWYGTNAAGLCKIDLQSLPFTAWPYHRNFITDVLTVPKLPGLSAKTIPPSLQKGALAYALRYCYVGHTLVLAHSAFNIAEENSIAFRYNDNKLIPLPTPPGTHPAVRGLSVTPGGILYAIDIDGNIWIWKNLSAMPDFVPSFLSLGEDGVADLEAYDDALWVSSYKQGLFEIKNNRVEKHFEQGNGKADLPSSLLTDLCKDPVDPHILWIGTLGDGLVKWNTTTGTQKVYTTDDGLPDNVIYSIVPDLENNLWLSTNNGISRLNLKTGTFRNYNVNDGLNANEFNRFHDIRLPDGKIAFGGMEGFTTFDPADFARDTFVTRVALTKLYINNVAVNDLARSWQAF